MCFFSKPKIPQVTPPPPPPIVKPVSPPATRQDPKVIAARTKSKQQAALAAGRTSTIFTSGLGLADATRTVAAKGLLGA